MKGDNKNIFLAIETSESVCSVALGSKNKFLGEITLNKPHAHNERLAWMADTLLREHGKEMKDVGEIFIAAGPGSYTGLRIGFSLARGLAFAHKTPVIPVPTPEIYAYKAAKKGKRIVAVIDARRNELFYGEYLWKNETLSEVENVSVVSVEKLAERYRNEKVLICGSGVYLLKNLIGEKDRAELVISVYNDFITASHLLEYGMLIVNRGKREEYNLEEPLYVRDFKGTY